jgi:hypothetical protein
VEERDDAEMQPIKTNRAQNNALVGSSAGNDEQMVTPKIPDRDRKREEKVDTVRGILGPRLNTKNANSTFTMNPESGMYGARFIRRIAVISYRKSFHQSAVKIKRHADGYGRDLCGT